MKQWFKTILLSIKYFLNRKKHYTEEYIIHNKYKNIDWVNEWLKKRAEICLDDNCIFLLTYSDDVDFLGKVNLIKKGKILDTAILKERNGLVYWSLN